MTSTLTVRLLSTGDEARAQAFLTRHLASSVIPLSNLRAGGLVDEGRERQATWAAALDGDHVVGVAAHCWNGMVALQLPRALGATADAVLHAAVGASNRALAGLLGPWDQVEAAQTTLGLTGAHTLVEDLFELDLAALAIPPALEDGTLVCRRADDADRDVVLAMRRAFLIATLGRTPGPALDAEALAEITLWQRDGALFVLEDRGALVAMAALPARLPEVAQVGAVWTPPELRGRGYARVVVAGALLEARREGTTRAVLFTQTTNTPAQRAYRALGFTTIGSFGLVVAAA